MLGRAPEREEADRALTALTCARRRRLLFELYEAANTAGGDAISYADIAPCGDDRSRIHLYHHHLPKLEAAGYIEWNEAEETVRAGPRWDEIEPLLELVHSHLSELPPYLRGNSAARDEVNS